MGTQSIYMSICMHVCMVVCMYVFTHTHTHKPKHSLCDLSIYLSFYLYTYNLTDGFVLIFYHKGEIMHGTNFVPVPPLSPGQTADISVSMMSPRGEMERKYLGICGWISIKINKEHTN